MKTPEERTVVEAPPNEEAVETWGERELADADADLVVHQRALR
jgi:hypothetical protein